jgi:hypothetical protein
MISFDPFTGRAYQPHDSWRAVALDTAALLIVAALLVGASFITP